MNVIFKQEVNETKLSIMRWNYSHNELTNQQMPSDMVRKMFEVSNYLFGVCDFSFQGLG